MFSQEIPFQHLPTALFWFKLLQCISAFPRPMRKRISGRAGELTHDQRQQRQRCWRVTRLCRGNICSSSLPLPRRKSASFQTKGECHKVRHHILRFQWFQCPYGSTPPVSRRPTDRSQGSRAKDGSGPRSSSRYKWGEDLGCLATAYTRETSLGVSKTGLSSGLPTWESNEKRRQLITWNENPIHFWSEKMPQ